MGLQKKGEVGCFFSGRGAFPTCRKRKRWAAFIWEGSFFPPVRPALQRVPFPPTQPVREEDASRHLRMSVDASLVRQYPRCSGSEASSMPSSTQSTPATQLTHFCIERPAVPFPVGKAKRPSSHLQSETCNAAFACLVLEKGGHGLHFA